MLLFGKRYADTVARLRVPTGFLLVAVFAWLSRPTPLWMALGIPISLAGLALRAWAAGCLAKNQQLATGGPYAYTRNPLYLGTLLVAAGLAIASRSVGLGVLTGAVFVFIYLPVIELEEQHLRRLFGDYAAYARSVPGLWPRLRPMKQEGAIRFRPALYFRNQEYNAAAGFTAGLAFLIWKMRG